MPCATEELNFLKFKFKWVHVLVATLLDSIALYS